MNSSCLSDQALIKKDQIQLWFLHHASPQENYLKVAKIKIMDNDQVADELQAKIHIIHKI